MRGIIVTASRPGMDEWTLHDLSDPRWCIWESPRGRDRFEVMERGAGSRGTGRTRAKARTLEQACELAATLPLSTTEDILAHLTPYDDHDRKRLADLHELGTPGTRLWVLPGSGPGMGCAATSLGLAVSGAEALFGSNDLDCWLIHWVTDDGTELKGLYAVSLADAERAWWIRDTCGNCVAGGPPIYDESRALEIAAKYNGTAQLGPYPAPMKRT